MLLCEILNLHMKKLLLLLILPFCVYSQNITQPESLQSLYIETYRDSIFLGSATGFIIKPNKTNYLVTNYHVLTKKNPINNQWLDPKNAISPNKVLILFISEKGDQYVIKTERLFDDKGNKNWYEHKLKNEFIDVVELPLKDTLNVSIFPVNYKESAYDSVRISTLDKVYILGFPKGVRSFPSLPVWKSGTIASEPEFDQDSKPLIWVDAVTYPGMSGAPVYFKSNEVLTMNNGKRAIVSGSSKFMGVFSHAYEFVYGAFWKSSYLKKIFDSLP